MADTKPDRDTLAYLEGAIAGARGLDYENPYGTEAADWTEGFENARLRCRNGEDRAGHPGGVPHVCTGNPRAVCNCCASCERACLPSFRGLLGAAVDHVLHRIGLRPRSGS